MTNKNWKALPVKTILKNVELVLKTNDSNKLSKGAYDCLYLMSGFIAHYNLYGFQENYEKVSDLAQDILDSRDSQDPERYIRDTFFVESYGMEYCQSKADVYQGLKELAEKYITTLKQTETENTKTYEIELARSLLAKHGVN